ncbi:xylulokinase [Flavisolibacter nicotianae]|uniref:xylulokinase n=1 Tax=Flavisolibacter nicotianae TaxID=2364882 RepID=UPI000EB4B055|nr:FGGY family carbohydrate kinase [Flavisolibacter nicotianae]
MLLLGIDIGTSSIKVSVVDAGIGTSLASAQFPETEADILAPQPGWAEQSPDLWWEHTVQAILKCNSTGAYNPKDIRAIGIAYQMHGLVLVDKEQAVLRNSIIWCDGRAVSIGEAAFDAIGEDRCLSHLLNSPGNFTAAKLAWVKENEPQVYSRIDKILLPGDFIAMRLTGETTTTTSALSEGIFWDFQENAVSKDVMRYFGFDESLIPSLQPLFAPHGGVKEDVATRLSLTQGIPVTYKAGDQPNNAFSLNVLNPGEVAATAGTSGVIYGVSDNLGYDLQSRINSFAHVNYEVAQPRIGILLCINGTGIFNRWVRNMVGAQHSYESLNTEAARIAAGADGLMALPFGNGAERMLNNRIVGAHFHHIDFNLHTAAHLVRAAQEGIAFSFRYGLDIMRENGMEPGIIRAGRANMFLSDVFTQSFVNATGVPVELYQTDGSVGAALGAGVGAKIFGNPQEAFAGRKPLRLVEPSQTATYDSLYGEWKALLEAQLQKTTDLTQIVNR